MRQRNRLGGEKNNPAVPPCRVPSGYLGAAHLVGKSKNSRWCLVRAILCLILVGLSVVTPLMEPQTAWAATQAHHTSTRDGRNLPSDLAGHRSLQNVTDVDPINDYNWCADPSSPETQNCLFNTPPPNCYDDGTSPYYRGCSNEGNCNSGCYHVKYGTGTNNRSIDYCDYCNSDSSKNPENISCQSHCTNNTPSTCVLLQNNTFTPASGDSCNSSNALQSTDCVYLDDNNKWQKSDTCSQNGAVPVGSGPNYPEGVGDLLAFIDSIIDLINMGFDVAGALLKYDFTGWVICMLTAGAVSCPTVSGTPWSFDCPIVDQNNNVLPGTSDETIYQAALNAQGASVKADWLSGDATKPDINSGQSSAQSEPGHLTYTFPADTINQPNVAKLFSLSLGLSFTMIGPLFVLIGFQIGLAAVRMRSLSARASVMDALGQMLLAAALVGLAFYMIQMLLDLINSLDSAITGMYANPSLSYISSQTPNDATKGSSVISFAIPGDTPGSMRALVVPMSLWGCILDDFIGILATRVAGTIGSSVPVVGGAFSLLGNITEIPVLIRDIGEFGLLILSVTIWGQAIARVILINYYIILAPVALACWGLPGGVGNQIVRSWFKGFLQLLFMQPVQLLILVSMPSLMPDFGKMQFPQGGSLIHGPMQSFLVQVPVLITVFAAVGAPKIMMGKGPMQMVVEAGKLTGKTVAAAMLAISSKLRK